jgi:HAD superfamily hydrolase (TIGR01509 family)
MTYLFDFDGTLVDSMPVYVSTMLHILDDFQIPYGDDIVQTITPLGTLGTADYFISLGVPRTKEEILALMGEGMIRAYRDDIPAKAEVVDTLLQLKERGDSLHVLTASPHITLDPCLKRLGIFDLFDNVWSCDDFGTTKSDPNIYALAAAALGTEPENVLFLDDNLGADKTAKSAGMKVCGVYDKSSEEYTDEIKAVADFYIEDFSELLDIDF